MDELQSQEGVLVRGGEGAGGGGGRGSAGVGGESGGTAGTAGMHRRKSGLEPLKHFVSGWGKWGCSGGWASGGYRAGRVSWCAAEKAERLKAVGSGGSGESPLNTSFQDGSSLTPPRCRWGSADIYIYIYVSMYVCMYVCVYK